MGVAIPTLVEKPSPCSGELLCGQQSVSGPGVCPKGLASILAGILGTAEGSGLEGYLLKWGNGVCREVKGRELGFLVVEELPPEAFAESHSPWL